MRQEDHTTSSVTDRPAPHKKAGTRRARCASPDKRVAVDNLPDRIPVQRREMEAVEMYLGLLLDEILRTGR
jgi:hypothetical protein